MLYDIWKILTFQSTYGPVDYFTIFMGIMLWICILCLLTIIIILALYSGCTIYRLLAYSYTTETFHASVTGRHFTPEHTRLIFSPATHGVVPQTECAKYNVSIITSNQLKSTINDKELYYQVRKGSRLKVTMKIGRSRSNDPKIRYWRILDYTY